MLGPKNLYAAKSLFILRRTPNSFLLLIITQGIAGLGGSSAQYLREFRTGWRVSANEEGKGSPRQDGSREGTAPTNLEFG